MRSHNVGDYAWLLAPRPRPDRTLIESVDADGVCQFGYLCWQALSAIVPAIEHHLPGQSTRSITPLLDRLAAVRVFSETQLQIGKRVLQALDQLSIQYVLLKGSAARFIAYPDPVMRTGTDIDIAVKPGQLNETVDCLKSLGFFAGEWDVKERRFYLANKFERAQVEHAHYELGFWVRRQKVLGLSFEDEKAIRNDAITNFLWHLNQSDELCCYTTIDVHHKLSLDLPAEPLIDGAIRHFTGNTSVMVPSLTDLMFHLIFKIYWEGVFTYLKGGYQYADLARLCPLMTDKHWDALFSKLSHYRLESAAFYVLRRLPTFLDTPLSPVCTEYIRSLSYLEKGTGPSANNDLGDVWDKLWGFRPATV